MKHMLEIPRDHITDNPDPIRVETPDMADDFYTPAPPEVDHAEQNKLAALFAALLQPTRLPLFDRGKHRRAGVTKNKMQPLNKARAKMARESKRRNRVR
jgi:hypothetical protein